MTAYISISYSLRKTLDKELNTIMDVLNTFSITPFIFVDQYQFDPGQERQMMQQATADIDRCDILIAETSDKAIGIGIEAGYAKAKGKPVIYIRHKHAEHSTTLSGLSDFRIIYENCDDLRKQFTDTTKHILGGVRCEVPGVSY